MARCARPLTCWQALTPCMLLRVAGVAAGPAAGAALLVAPPPRANLTDWSKAPTLRMSKTWICRGMGKYVGARTHHFARHLGLQQPACICLHAGRLPQSMHVGDWSGAQALYGQLRMSLPSLARCCCNKEHVQK